MTLREQILSDNESVFFSLDDFATEVELLICNHPVRVRVVEDGDQLLNYRHIGIYEGSLLIYARAEDLPSPLKAGDALIYNRAKWYVEDAREDLGIWEIVLKRNL